jgi:hopanoid biosynthesis associated RND transporter like protein HpnN
MPKKLISAIVHFCSRHPWLILAAALLLATASGSYVADRFEINTDINKLISSELPWRQREVAFSKAFPKQEMTILAVIDGPTPELAEDAAAKLTRRLQQEPSVIQSAKQSSGGPFFQRNGLLFVPEIELRETLDQFSKSRALLEPLAADPTLRGVMGVITLTLRGVQARRVSLDSLAPQFESFSKVVEDVLANRPTWFSWRELLSGQPATRRETRQFVEVYPILDFNSLQPGEDASDAIRQAVKELKLADNNVMVRLTGPVSISDEEFGTLKEGAALNGAVTVLSVILILWLALHSARIILAVLVSLFTGLAITAAVGLALVGAFNPISIAFFVLFVGMGVDFGLQFSVGYRAERFDIGDLFSSLVATARNTGGRLALAAMATAAGFMAFTPTAYKGLSELGEIAGAGMIVAFLTSITILPAMLRLLNPPAEPHPLGYAFLSPLDNFLERHRIQVLVITLCAVLAGLPLLYWLRFDFNPMNLRSPKVESVATYLDLRKDPETAGRTIEVLTPSLSQADALAKTVGALPEVARVMTLSSFVPEDQDKKMALIKETASSLSKVLNPPQSEAAPSDEETVQSIEGASNFLSVVAKRAQGTPGATAALRLSNALSNLAKASPDIRAKAETALVMPLKITLEDIRQSLNPEKVTLANLPPELASDWKAANGMARVSVSPKGDSNNNRLLRHFVEAVTKVAPEATGEAIGIQKAGDTIVGAFIQAAIWALVSIALLLWLALKRLSHVALTLFPLLLACVVTLELCVLIDLPLNFANIIALPLLLGVGVAFKIYYIMAWREGRSGLLASPLTRAVFYSGMTTAVAFGSLWLSNHPGTSSMGKLLALSLVSTMAAAVLFQPLLMGPPSMKEKPEEKKPMKAPYLETTEHTS